MSAREEQPDTVPPPAGEDDAYSAATKVGVMPAELMARLRAEGLLPDEAEPTPVVSTASASAPTKRPPPMPSASIENGGDEAPDEMTQVYAELSPQEVVPAEASSAPPPMAPARAMEPAFVVETPIAFAATPSAIADGDEAKEIAAFAGRSKSRMLVAVLVVMVALVAFAFTMALLSQRR